MHSPRLILTLSSAVLFAFLAAALPARAQVSWCKRGSTVALKGVTLKVLGADKAAKGRCKLTTKVGNLTVEYSVDQKALEKLRSATAKDVGSGCIRFSIKKTKADTELCFGKK